MFKIDSVKTIVWRFSDRNKRTKSRIYVTPKGETVLENFLGGRRTRPHTEYRKLMPELFERLGVEPHKVSWSQKAGCSCGCSPGFIVDGLLSHDDTTWTAYDVAIDVVEA